MKLNNKDTKTMKNTKCSQCGKSPVEGIRYYCLNCASYVLCQICEKEYGEKHGHALLMIRNEADLEMCKAFIIKQKKLNNLNEIVTEEKEKEKIKKDYSKLFSKIMNVKNLYITRNNNNFIPIEVIIKNNGDEDWPTPCYFSCDEESELKGEKVKLLKCNGKPGEECSLKIRINLKDVKSTGTFKSTWQLENENGIKFGQKVVFTIKDIFEKCLVLKTGKQILKAKKKVNYIDELEKNVEEIRQQFDILFSKPRIRNALIKTKGNKENAIKILYTENNRNSYYQKI